MRDDLEPDSSDDVLDKVDALLKKHQNRSFSPSPRAASTAAAPPNPPADSADFDDIPTLTDIVETPPPFTADALYAGTPQDFASEVQLHDLEARLCRELEARIAPQLSAAFGQMFDELLEQAKERIGETVRQHLAHELNKSPHPTPGNSADETQV